MNKNLAGDNMFKNTSFPLVTEKDKTLPYYLLSVGCDYIQDRIQRPEGFPSYQWIQSIDGEGELIYNEKKERIDSNKGIFLFPAVPHEYYSVKGVWKVNFISFDGNAIESFLRAAGIKESAVFYIKNPDILSAKIKKALSVSQSQSSLRNIEASSILYELLMDILMYSSKSSDDSTETQYMKLGEVFQFIEENYSSVITLEELASTINITPQHLCLLFKSITSLRPFEYIKNVRITKSKDLIITNSHLEINEIAKSVGYDNTSYFCSIFKKIEGITPGKFKRLYW